MKSEREFRDFTVARLNEGLWRPVQYTAVGDAAAAECLIRFWLRAICWCDGSSTKLEALEDAWLLGTKGICGKLATEMSVSRAEVASVYAQISIELGLFTGELRHIDCNTFRRIRQIASNVAATDWTASQFQAEVGQPSWSCHDYPLSSLCYVSEMPHQDWICFDFLEVPEFNATMLRCVRTGRKTQPLFTPTGRDLRHTKMASGGD